MPDSHSGRRGRKTDSPKLCRYSNFDGCQELVNKEEATIKENVALLDQVCRYRVSQVGIKSILLVFSIEYCIFLG